MCSMLTVRLCGQVEMVCVCACLRVCVHTCVCVNVMMLTIRRCGQMETEGVRLAGAAEECTDRQQERLTQLAAEGASHYVIIIITVVIIMIILYYYYYYEIRDFVA